MKISVLLASPDALDYNLIDVMRVLNTTFDELGEKLNFIKLDQRKIPPLSSQYPVNDVANIVNQLSNSDGVIFACTSNLFAPCAVMQNFLDYLSLPMYSNFLKDKNCFTIVVSNEYGEMEAAQYLTSVVQHFGGYAPVVTSINRSLAAQFDSNQDISEIFEKQVEDYYRILRQNRKFFNSSVQVVSQNFNNIGFQQPQPQVQQPPRQAQMQPQNFAQGEYYPVGEAYGHDTYTGVPNFDASQHIQEKLGVSQASNLTQRSYIPEPLQPEQNNYVDFSAIDNQQNNSFLDNNFDYSKQNNDNIRSNNMNHQGSNNMANNYQGGQGKQQVGQPYHEQPVGQPYHDQQVGQPRYDQPVGQPYHDQPVGQPYHDQPVSQPRYEQQSGQPYHEQQVGQPYHDQQMTHARHEQPVNQPRQDQPTASNFVQQNLNLKQMTLNLEKNFLPQHSNGLVTEIQFKISGNENFDTYVQINGTDCRCHEGVSHSADLTIIATDDVWLEVLQGQITTQKAFMTGQLKVRGNFVLLPRFDTLFKH